MKNIKKLFLIIFVFLMMISFTGCSIYVDKEALKELIAQSIHNAFQGIKETLQECIEDASDAITGDFLMSYDACGGVFVDGDDQSSSVLEQTLGFRRKLTTQKPTLKGHHFMGWSTEYNPDNNEVGNPKYQAGDRFKNFSDAKLYAVWMNHEDFLINLSDNTEEHESYAPSQLRKIHEMKEVTGKIIVCSCGARIEDPDSNGDGISDYCTWSLTRTSLIKGDVHPFARALDESLLFQSPDLTFSDIRYLTIQANDDYDEDGAKNGEEVIVTLLNDYRVSVDMLSDPTWREPESYYKMDKVDYDFLIQENYTATLFLEDSSWIENAKLWLVASKKDIARQQMAESLVQYIEIISKKEICAYRIEFLKSITDGLNKNVNNMFDEMSNVAEQVEKTHTEKILNEYILNLKDLSSRINDAQIALDKDFTPENYGQLEKLEEELSVITKAFSEKMDNLNVEGKLAKVGLTDYTKCFELKLDKNVLKAGKGISKVVEVGGHVINVWNVLEDWTNTSLLYAQLNTTVNLYEEVSTILTKVEKNGKVKYVREAAESLLDDWEEEAIVITELLNSIWNNFDDEIVDMVVSKVFADISPYLFAMRLGQSIGEGVTNKNAVTTGIVRTISASVTSEVCAAVLQSKLIEVGNNVVYLEEDAEGVVRLLAYLRLAGEQEALKTNDEGKKNILDQIRGMDNEVLEENTTEHIENINKIVEKYFHEYEMISDDWIQ